MKKLVLFFAGWLQCSIFVVGAGLVPSRINYCPLRLYHEMTQKEVESLLELGELRQAKPADIDANLLVVVKEEFKFSDRESTTLTIRTVHKKNFYVGYISPQQVVYESGRAKLRPVKWDGKNKVAVQVSKSEIMFVPITKKPSDLMIYVYIPLHKVDLADNACITKEQCCRKTNATAAA